MPAKAPHTVPAKAAAASRPALPMPHRALAMSASVPKFPPGFLKVKPTGVKQDEEPKPKFAGLSKADPTGIEQEVEPKAKPKANPTGIKQEVPKATPKTKSARIKQDAEPGTSSRASGLTASSSASKVSAPAQNDPERGERLRMLQEIERLQQEFSLSRQRSAKRPLEDGDLEDIDKLKERRVSHEERRMATSLKKVRLASEVC